MNLNRTRLKWLTILGPLLYVLVVAVFFLTEHTHTRTQWAHNLSMTLGLGLVGVVPFSFFVFRRIALQEEEVIRRSEAMAALAAVGTAITGVFDLDQNLHSLVERAKGLLNGDVAVLCLADERTGLVPKVRLGPPEVFANASPRGGSLPAQATSSSEPTGPLGVSKEDVACFGIRDGTTGAIVKAPLLKEGKAVGALCVARTSQQPFSPLEVEVLNDLATLAVVAVENSRLQEQLKSMTLIEERQRIAREMHDGLAQDLIYLRMKSGHVEQKLTVGQIDEALTDLKEMRQVARESYEEVRQAIHGFRSMVPRGQGLIAALGEHLAQIEERTGIAMGLKVQNEEIFRFRPWAEIQITRIIQEALANIRKHSQAKHGWVTFQVENEIAKVAIQDDGIGFDMEAHNGNHRQSFGLEIMRERAEEIGGELSIVSSPDRGTTVEVRVPLGA